jgi:dTDP-4-amino-4,6-dideoxygalactose transaminase
MSVLDRGVLSGALAPEIAGLEREFAEYLGVDYCISTNSGTSALHCCCAAVGLRPGDEVIVPAFTFIASAMAILHQGAVPVFCDIDPATFNIDASLIEERITDSTKAILVVHLHGLPAEMDEILAIAERHGLAVIEDVAQAPGATYKGTRVGALGACAAFSLQATKNLSGGEGGLFVTNDRETWLAARRLSMFGEDVPPPDHFGRVYWSHGLGYNYRNHELSAAFARSQLKRLDRYNATAQANASILTEGLAGIPGLIPPLVPPDRTSVYYFYRVRLDLSILNDAVIPASELRDRVVVALREKGVNAMVWQHWPIPAHPAFRGGSLQRGEAPTLDAWTPAAFPSASGTIDESFVLLGSETPLMVQEPALMDDYVRVLEEVAERLRGDLLAGVEIPPHPVDTRLTRAWDGDAAA